MFAGPREYLEQFAVPNFEEYKARRADKRAALNAVMSTYHVSDWLYQYKGADTSGYWDAFFPKTQRHQHAYNGYLAKNCPHLDTLRLIANGTKHFYIPGRHVEPKLIKPAPTPWGPIGWAPLGWLHQFPSFIVAEHDGHQLELTTILRRVIDWWPHFLSIHGC